MIGNVIYAPNIQKSLCLLLNYGHSNRICLYPKGIYIKVTAKNNFSVSIGTFVKTHTPFMTGRVLSFTQTQVILSMIMPLRDTSPE